MNTTDIALDNTDNNSIISYYCDGAEHSNMKFENFVALYDREPTDVNEIAIRKNDRLILLERMDKDVLRVRNIRSKKNGLINKNLVKSFTHELETNE